MAAPVARDLTVADLDRYEDDGRHKVELVDGELFMSPKANARHQHVLGLVFRRLLEWAEAHGGAAFVEPGVYRSERTYVIPDVVLLTAATLRHLTGDEIDVVPDLVVEVSSPSTRRLDLVVKRSLYERHGVAEYWFVDVDADRIEVYRLRGDRYDPPEVVGPEGSVSPPHLPGLTVEVADVLRPLGGPPA